MRWSKELTRLKKDDSASLPSENKPRAIAVSWKLLYNMILIV